MQLKLIPCSALTQEKLHSAQTKIIKQLQLLCFSAFWATLKDIHDLAMLSLTSLQKSAFL